MKAPVNRVIPFSSVDGPGNRTAIFLQGCSFNCRYCHNPETIRACIHCGKCVDVCPTGAIRMKDGRVAYDIEKCVMCDACIRACGTLSSPRIRWMTAGEAMDEARRNMPFIRGLTVSGGECTLHRDFLLELAELAGRESLGVLLDSNGSYDFSEDPELCRAIEGVMLDVKAWDDIQHREMTDAGNETVKRNLIWLAENGKLEEVRIVVVPELMDARETVMQVSSALMNCGAGNVCCKLIRFRPVGVRRAFADLREPTVERMRELEQTARTYGLTNTIVI